MRDSIYPSRYEAYEDLLNRKLREAVQAAARGETVQDGLGGRVPLPRWARAVLAIGGTIVLLSLVTGGRSENPSRLSTARGTIFSAQLAGAQSSAQEIIPAAIAAGPSASPSAAPTDGPSAAPSAEPSAVSLPRTPTRSQVVYPTAPIDPRPPTTLSEVLFDATGEGTIHVAAPTAPPPATVNVGTRLPAVLRRPIVTSPAGTPVTAEIGEDVVANGRTVLRAGAQLVGDAMAIEEDDRVQIVFSAVVVDGKTTPLSGIVLYVDEQLGIPAQVLKKGSRGKRGLGKALGIVGSALTFGLVPHGNDVLGTVAAEAAARTAQDLSQVEARWTRSDKILRAPAGSVSVFLRSDLVLQ